jgi:hypothetical protein
VGFEKLQHALPHQLIADAAAAKIEGMFGICVNLNQKDSSEAG